MKDSWDKVPPVTPVRAASPSWQMERENEMIVISYRLFASLAKEGYGEAMYKILVEADSAIESAFP